MINPKMFIITRIIFYTRFVHTFKVAVGLGLEPRLMGPKPAILPLDDSTM